MNHPSRRTAASAVGILALVGIALSGCASSSASSSSSGSGSTVISSSECAKNKAAGEVTFVTSYAYLASVGIADVIAADMQGYYKDVCIDLKIVPGTGTNDQILSAGKANLAGTGGPAEILAAQDQGANIVSIATYGDTSAIELITMADGPIKSLKDLEGKTVGYKGAVSPEIEQMLVNAGVDVSKVNFVSVGYDPLILPQGKIDALTGYKSNEPQQLIAQGYKVDQWDPEKYEVTAAFNSQAANVDFAKEHPTVVSDFLRASLKGYAWMSENSTNLGKVMKQLQTLTPSGFNMALSTKRIQIELTAVKDSQPDGTKLGENVPAQWKAEAQGLVDYKLLKKMPDLSESYDNSYLDSIYSGSELVWGDSK